MAYFYKLAIALSVPLIILAIFVATLYLYQNRLLYLPAKTEPDDFVPDGMQAWTARGPVDIRSLKEPILGLLAEPPSSPAGIDTAIVFHGNAGHAGHRTYYSQQLTALGMRVILAEYPGYGPRSGKPDESLLVDDAANIVRLAHQQYGQSIWLIGESLGAGVVAAIAGREPHLIQGVVMITPWNRLSEVALHHYPFLPVRSLLRSQYDSIHSLAKFDGPKLVIVAGSDTIVPAELGLDLFREITGPKHLLVIDDAGHNDWTMRASVTLWADTLRWLRKSSHKPE